MGRLYSFAKLWRKPSLFVIEYYQKTPIKDTKCGISILLDGNNRVRFAYFNLGKKDTEDLLIYELNKAR